MRVRVHSDHTNYQLLILFDFSKDDWENYPWVVQYHGMFFGATQSGAYLELALNRVSNFARTELAKLIIKYFRAVDNMLHSFETKEQMIAIAEEIDEVMTSFNFPLQRPYTTAAAHH